MSHIPKSAMPHAKPHEASESHDTNRSHPDDKPGKANTASRAKRPDHAESFADRAGAAAEAAVATVKAHPGAAIAIGATLVAGIAAAIAAPSMMAKAQAAPKKKASSAKANGNKLKAK